VTKERYEIVVEGTSDPAQGEAGWRPYEFKGKPGDQSKVPRQYAPYHLRLDWLMWFAAMESPFHNPWLIALMVKLLEADRQTLRLLRHDPFGGHPPAAVRAILYRYRFSSWKQLRREHLWWTRSPAGEYLPAVTLDAAGNPRRLRG